MDFCMNLAGEIIMKEINENPNENFVKSPLSLNCLFNMVASGAKGRTLEQLLEFLESESIADINAKSSRMIGLARMDGESNKKGKPFFPNEGIQFGKSPKTLESARDSSNNRLFSDQFPGTSGMMSPAQTNRKSSFTFDNICDNVPGMMPSGPMNEEYYRRKEETSRKRSSKSRNEEPSRKRMSPFETSITRDEAFYLLNGTTVEVPFMKTYEESHYYASFEDFKILKLPYAGRKGNKRFSMYLLLPHKNDGLQELMQNFNSKLTLLQKNLPLREVELSKLWIPKFKFSYGFEASEILKKLGVTLPFEFLGDFTEIVDSPLSELVYVSNIIHKSFIHVNEEGREAAAASLLDPPCGCTKPVYPPPPLPSSVADHPFMFMIKEEVSDTVFHWNCS
ncbi:unnamed protein product [Dovyalis caffra]|uniref:Serpin domain-containing protein n=1 Tax=Dovyalis caffra TaxID=77055 RepID=A0AAV1SET9_9ROSI|nr:unnamed protein product [Dovyalis caffra]